MIKQIKNKLTKKNKRGFTLIELIVVIAIVAVLAAVGIPAIAGQVGRSRQASVDANAKLIAEQGQIMITASEANGTFTPGGITLAMMCAEAGVTATNAAEPVARRAEMDGATQVSETIMQITYTENGYTGTWSRT